MKGPRVQMTLLLVGAALAGGYLLFLGGVYAIMHMLRTRRPARASP